MAEGEPDGSKGGRWNKLRNKLLPIRKQSEDDAKGPGVDDLSDFLPSQRPSQDNKRPLGPKLDTSSASKWPEAGHILKLRQAQQPDENLPPLRFHKPRRRPGLSVDFVEDYADVIGIGGDDSEEPVNAVSQRRNKRMQPASKPQQRPVGERFEVNQIPSAISHSHAPIEVVRGQGTAQRMYADAQMRPAHEAGPDLRKPSPGHTPGAPYPTQGQHSPPRHADYFGSLDKGMWQGDQQAPPRSRAHSDAPSLKISAPEHTHSQRDAQFHSMPPVLPAMRQEDRGPLLSAGDMLGPSPERVRFGSMGEQRNPTTRPIPRCRTGSYTERRSRETSPGHGSRPSTGGSHDPGVFQAPQYPPALNTIPLGTSNEQGMPDPIKVRRYQMPTGLDTRRRSPSMPEQHAKEYASPVRGMVRPHEHQRGPSDTLYPPESHTSEATSRSASPYSYCSRSYRSEGSPQPRSRPRAGSSSQQRHEDQAQPEGKRCIFKCNLQSFAIDAASAKDSQASQSLAQLPRWRRLQVFETPPQPDSDEVTPGIAVIIFDPQTSYTDSAIQGQHFWLEASTTTSQSHKLTVLSEPSPLRKVRLRSSAAPDTGEQAQAQLIAECSDIVRTQQTVQTYTFLSTPDLSGFYLAITGSNMTHFGTAHLKPPKKHGLVIRQLRDHPVIAQICVISRKGHAIRLAAFLEDGRALNAELHAWDTFEEAELKGTASAIKLVGVKSCFADRWIMNDDERAERSSEDEKDAAGKSFLPLDMQMQPELNEDITIGFEDEEEKRRFAMALPAEVGRPKGFTLMRRI